MVAQLPIYFRESEPSQVRAASLPYHLQDIRMPQHWPQTARGKGIKVAVVDTGIDPEHKEFENVSIVGKGFVGRFNGSGYYDGNDHGTHVAGIIAGASVGVAPDCELLVAKALGDNGSGRNYAIAEAINWAVDEGAHIINLSLGSFYDDHETRVAIDRAHNSGTLVFAATGNERASRVSYPAVHCIAVGAVGADLKHAYFSNIGAAVDLVGYGVKVYSAVPNNQYQEMSGTSMATPFVVGLFANRLSAELKYLGEIKTRTPADALKLETLVIDLGPDGRDKTYGRGFPDVDRGFYEGLDAEQEPQTGLVVSAEYQGNRFGPVELPRNS